MSSENQDNAKVRLAPPLAFLATIVLGFALQRWVLALPLPGSTGQLRAATLLFAILGSALLATALGLFRRSGQDPKPWQPTPAIISTGIYKYTRNPMYVGMALTQAAFATFRANGWILAMVPLALALVYLTAVRHEEEYLSSKFGDAYSAYQRSVRRWL